jgi:hypothetical protein
MMSAKAEWGVQSHSTCVEAVSCRRRPLWRHESPKVATPGASRSIPAGLSPDATMQTRIKNETCS